MTLNGLMALILRYFTEFVYDVVVKKFTFGVHLLMSFLSLRRNTHLISTCARTEPESVGTARLQNECEYGDERQ